MLKKSQLKINGEYSLDKCEIGSGASSKKEREGEGGKREGWGL